MEVSPQQAVNLPKNQGENNQVNLAVHPQFRKKPGDDISKNIAYFTPQKIGL